MATDEAMSHEAQADEIVIYGSNWCGWTQRALKRMRGLNVQFRYIEVDDDPQAEALIGSWNNGRSIRPTFSINQTVLVNPGDEELMSTLREHKYLPAAN